MLQAMISSFHEASVPRGRTDLMKTENLSRAKDRLLTEARTAVYIARAGARRDVTKMDIVDRLIGYRASGVLQKMPRFKVVSKS